MPFTTALKDIPRLPAPQARLVDENGNPTKEIYSYFIALRAWAETADSALAEGGTQVTTVGALPSASGIQGVRYIVTDSNSTTFMATVASGGANIVPVFSNGTNWKIG
jgi:hypothetical protein